MVCCPLSRSSPVYFHTQLWRQCGKRAPRAEIPIAEWKLAVDLEATRAIQNQEGTPAFNCDCEWCSSWCRSYKHLLPIDLQEQLVRVGIDIEHPIDLYKYDSNDDEVCLRVIFHAAGKVLSGPNQWISDEFGRSLLYISLRKEPFLSIVVIPQRESFESAPVLEGSNGGELIQIDFRLGFPKNYV